MRQKRSWVLASLVLASGCAGTFEDEVSQPEEGVEELGNPFFVPPSEKFMYVSAINRGGSADPDMMFVVGLDPKKSATYGKIVHRADMGELGDEVHHMGYSHDKKRMLIPGVFSGRMYVFDLNDPLKPKLTRTTTTTSTGYVVPHTVIPYKPGRALVTMIGALNATTSPGGIVEVDDTTGNVIRNFGPGPDRGPDDVGPTYMYDFDYHQGTGISTTFGPPALVGGGINPAGLGNTIAIWNVDQKKVTQEVDLGANNGALEVRFIKKPGSRYGYINTPGTSAIWLFEDEDNDGNYSFHQVLGPEDGLLIPVDMLLSFDHKYMYITNWVGDNVQQWDISDRYNPVLVGQATVPHANMIRLSVDGKRLYVTNGLLSTWDDDLALGGPRNTNYGLWAFHVNTKQGGLTSFTGNDSPWVQFDSVQKKTSTGPAGPHMMLFDAAATIVDHH
jgi:methanethiol oxidase